MARSGRGCTAVLGPPCPPLGHPRGPVPSALGRMDPGNRLIRVLEAEPRTTQARNAVSRMAFDRTDPGGERGTMSHMPAQSGLSPKNLCCMKKGPL